MSNAKIAMQFGASQFSAEGTEEFVHRILNEWVALFEKNPQASDVNNHSQAGQSNGSKSNSGDPISRFQNVYDELEGALKIIANMPGDNKASKTRNTALALTYGRYLQGEQTTSAEAIRDACMDQGCYDASNFASHLKALKEKVAMNTKPGGGYDVKLTAPGRKAAHEFVENLNNALEG